MSSTAVRTTGTHRRGLNVTLWVLQGVIALFFLVAAAGPKLLGNQYAIDMFTQMGAGQWFRYAIGLLELAGAIGLLIPRLSGLASLGLVGLMIGAVATQVFVLRAPAMVVTPALLGVIAALIAWGRWSQTKRLAAMVKR
ncbi:DoxX family protein [Fodinicola feengrottensis]|uniref:DoxX family protein n=1 Tax=Fodinicola feengrottensis TaxID=435914 RepID=A0ABN2H0K8_9ACTN